MSTTTVLPLSHCPACRAPMAAATSPFKGTVPNPGDYSVCIECGAALRFTEHMGVRLTTESEMTADGMAEEVHRMQRAIAAQPR